MRFGLHRSCRATSRRWRIAAILVCLAALSAGCVSSKPKAAAPMSRTDQLAEVRAAIGKDPKDAALHYRLGNLLFDLAIYGEAAQAYQSAVALDPALAKGWTNLGLALRRAGQPQAAVDAYRRALAFEPDDSATIQNLIVAANAAGDADTLIDGMRLLAEAQPGASAPLADLAYLLYRLQRWQEAIPVFEKLVAIDSNAEDEYALGDCCFALEQWDRAEQAWRRVLALEPNHAAANKALAVLYWTLKQYDRAWDSAAQCQSKGIPLDAAFLADLRRDSGRDYTENPAPAP